MLDRKFIEATIVEVAFHKLASLFKVGPQMETRIPFDLLVYEDGVEFHMEKCLDWETALSGGA